MEAKHRPRAMAAASAKRHRGTNLAVASQRLGQVLLEHAMHSWPLASGLVGVPSVVVSTAKRAQMSTDGKLSTRGKDGPFAQERLRPEPGVGRVGRIGRRDRHRSGHPRSIGARFSRGSTCPACYHSTLLSAKQAVGAWDAKAGARHLDKRVGSGQRGENGLWG